MSSSSNGSADQALRQRFTETPIQISLTTSASTAQQLSQGRYRIVSDEDCFILQGGSGIASTMSASGDGHLLPAGVVDYLTVDGALDEGRDDTYLTGLVASGTATLHLCKQDDR
jgi:hypothetical protein